MKKIKLLMKRLSFMLMAAALPLVGAAQRVFLPYGYAARGGMSYCTNTYLPGWMAAESEQPVQDATFLIANPNFEEGDGNWSGTPEIMEKTGNKYANKSGKFDVSQELTNIPNGVYELSVNGFYEGERSRREAYVYAGMEAYALKSESEGDGNLWSNYYNRKVRAVVINNKLKIGVKGIYTSTNATSFDNFSLTYLGNYVVGFAAEIAEGYGDGVVPSWTADYEVAVHANGAVYKYKPMRGGSETTMLVAAENQFPRLNQTCTAANPYDGDDTAGWLTIPATQPYDEDGINTELNPMAACMEDGVLKFKNVCGLLKLNLTGDGVSAKTITVKANNGESLCGTGEFSFNETTNEPQWSCSDGSDEVTLAVEDDPIQLNATNPIPFYIVLPPDTYNGLTVTVATGVDDHKCVINLEETTIYRSQITEINAVYMSLEMTPENIALNVDDTKELNATVVPVSSTITWTSSNEDVATVSDGLVTAIGAGTATITATANGLNATCKVAVLPKGALLGKFTVGETADGLPITACFSKGNLYCYENTWNFENNQYDYRTYGTYKAVIDGTVTTTSPDHWGLFGWSTPLTNYGMITIGGENESAYLGDFNDWGTNSISNGGNAANQWRTLSGVELEYLLNVNGETGKRNSSWTRFAKATVRGGAGLLVFPDGTMGSNVCGVEITNANVENADFSGNNIDNETWLSLESAGVVFLPCAGYRSKTSVNFYEGTYGTYWSSSPYGTIEAYRFDFRMEYVHPAQNSHRYDGRAVRLATLFPVPAESVLFNNGTDDVVIVKGEEKQLEVTVSPSNATNVVTWTSSDGNVATVDDTGKVTAEESGTATITATVNGLTTTCTVHIAPVGSIPGIFTVSSSGQQVYFSKGNLYYDGISGSWNFEDEQYEYHGYDNPTDTWGLFGWSTNAEHNNWGMHTQVEHVTGYTSGNFKDWGENSISNGGNVENQWRTLNKNELNYILFSRDMLHGKPRYTINIEVPVVINDNSYKGLFVYPDNYNGDEVGNGGPNTWNDINAAGIVFLPCAGYRKATTVDLREMRGYYWTSLPSASANAANLYFYFENDEYIVQIDNNRRYLGRSVRLVTPLPVPATNVSLNKSAMGLETVGTETIEAMLSPSNATEEKSLPRKGQENKQANL